MNTTLLLAVLLSGCATPEEKAEAVLLDYGTDLLKWDYPALWQDVSKADQAVWTAQQLPVEIVPPAQCTAPPCDVVVSDVAVFSETRASGLLSINGQSGVQLLVLEDGVWKVQAGWFALALKKKAAQVFAKGLSEVGTDLWHAEALISTAATLDPEVPAYREAEAVVHALNRPPDIGSWERTFTIEAPDPGNKSMSPVMKYSLLAKSLNYSNQVIPVEPSQPRLNLHCVAEHRGLQLDSLMKAKQIVGVWATAGKKPTRTLDLQWEPDPPESGLVNLYARTTDIPGILSYMEGQEVLKVTVGFVESSDDAVMATFDISDLGKVLADMNQTCVWWAL